MRIESDYMSMKKRITSATTIAQLQAVDVSLNRLWRAGVFTTDEFQKLDVVYCDRFNALHKN